jgi:hypothetical protein
MPGKIDPKELAVNQDEMNLVYKYYWGIPTIQMCRNMIRQHLFSNGIEFKGKSGANANNFSQHIMEDFWLPFCEDALDQALTYGFVVWRTRKIGDVIVPIICLKDTYRLTVKEVEGVLEYKIYNMGEKNNEELKGAYVYDEFGYRPLIDGTLMSMLHTLIPDIQYYFTMVNCQVTLEKKRVKPPILTQLTNSRGMGNGTGESEGIDYDFYADADIAEAEEDAKYKRNKNAVDALKAQQKMYDDFFDPHEDHEVSAPSVLDQMVPIPSGQTIASYQPQQGRNDIPVILKSLQDTICGVLGVPKSMIMSDTPHKSDAVGTHQMFQTTIVWWKRQISEMCQMIYNIINAKELTNQVGDRLSKRANRPDTKDIYLMTKSMSSRITFPTTPFTTNEELFQLYTQGVIDWKTYCTYIARNTSIPMDTIPDEPLKDKEKKELMGIAKDPPPNQGLPGDPNAPGGSVKPGAEAPDRGASPTEKKEKENNAKEKKAEEGAAAKTNVQKDDKKGKDKDDAVNKAVGSKPAGTKAKDSKAGDTKAKQAETSQKQAPAKKKEGEKPAAKKGGDNGEKPPPKKGGDNDKDKKSPPKKGGEKDEKGDGDKKKKPDGDKKKPGDKKVDKSGKSEKSKGSDGGSGGKDKKFDKSGTDKKKPGDKEDDKKDDKKRKPEGKADESEEEKKKKKKKKDDKKKK